MPGAVEGTFRDQDFTLMDEKDVDEIDAYCIENGINRSDYVKLAIKSWGFDTDKFERDRKAFADSVGHLFGTDLG
jgi:hypothetical protein